jgi:hypothetical protein
VIARSGAGRRAAAAWLVLAVVAGACGTTNPIPSPPRATALAATTGPSASATTAPSSGSRPSTLVAIDPTLLDLLPDAVGGIALVESPEAAAESASDASLGRTAQSLAVAVGVDAASNNLVVASVVKLRPGIYSDEFFRDWRDSFDESVCGQAGGVAGNAQATIDGRTVYIGTCSGGVHTYHVHLEGPDAILSVNSVGDGRLGEQLVETLPD